MIFFIVVTIGYVIYYAAIITIDMNAKPKDALVTGETMESPDGMIPEEDVYDIEDEASREADSDDDFNEEAHEENHDDDVYHQEGNDDTYTNDVPEAESSYYQEPAYHEPSEAPSPEDDDIYGIDDQSTYEQLEEQAAEETPESDGIDEGDSSDEYNISDGEDEETLKEEIRRHLAEVAAAEGAEFVEAETHAEDDFVEEYDDGFRGIADSDNYDTGLAAEINASNEPIITESTTPVRQDSFASTIIGAWGGLKKIHQEHQEYIPQPESHLNPDNVVKEVHVTNL